MVLFLEDKIVVLRHFYTQDWTGVKRNFIE